MKYNQNKIKTIEQLIDLIKKSPYKAVGFTSSNLCVEYEDDMEVYDYDYSLIKKIKNDNQFNIESSNMHLIVKLK